MDLLPIIGFTHQQNHYAWNPVPCAQSHSHSRVEPRIPLLRDAIAVTAVFSFCRRVRFGNADRLYETVKVACIIPVCRTCHGAIIAQPLTPCQVLWSEKHNTWSKMHIGGPI